MTFDVSIRCIFNVSGVGGEGGKDDDGERRRPRDASAWQLLLGMALGLIVTAGITVPAAAQTSAGIEVSPTTSMTSRLQTTEAGGTAEFTVTLATGPTANVVLDVASSDTSRGTVLPASLTFTSTTWNSAQTVTLTGVNDDPPDFLSNPPIPNHSIGKKDYQVTLTVNQMATGDARYDAISSETVYAVNADDEYDLDVDLLNMATGLTVTEGGTKPSFKVELTRQPTANVTVTIASQDTTEGTVSPTPLIFTSTTWNMAQTVSVTGVEDNINDGPVTWPIWLNPSSTDTNYFSQETGMGGMTMSPRLRKAVLVITTDSTLPTVTLAVSPTSIAENGGEATVTAELSGQSTEAVTLTVTTPPMPADYTQSGMTLIIAARQTTSTGTVTLTAVDNGVDAPDKTVEVTATAAGGHGVAAPGALTVTITDDDATPTVTLAVAPTAITETGGVATVTATLNRASSEATTITVAAAAVPPAGAGDFTQSGTVLTIAAGQTTSTGTVTVTAVGNAVDAPDKTVRVTGTAGNTHGIVQPSAVRLTLTDDDDGPGMEIVPTMLALEERTTDPQQAKPYAVRLKTQPTAAVTVSVMKVPRNEGIDDVTVAPMTLTFDASNWDTAKTVTVTALRDEGNDGDDEVTLNHTAAGASEYASLGPDQHPSVTVRVTDVDPDPVLKVFEMGDDLKCELQDLPENLKMAIEGLDKEVECNRVDLPSKEGRDVRTAAGLFSLGTATAHMVVDIDPMSGKALKELDEVLETDLRVDMAVPASLQNDAKNIDQEMLHLLHLDNKEDAVWKEVGSGDIGANEISSEKPLENFFRFALAFENLKPKFDKEEETLTFTIGIADSKELPAATGGNPPLSYRLVDPEDLPDGLTYLPPRSEDSHGGMITGTPTTPTTDPQPYTLIVRDKNDDDDTLNVTIEVTSGIQSRDLALVLAGIGRTLAADVVEILGGRFSSAPASRLQVTLGGQALYSSTPSPLPGEGQGEGAVLQSERPLLQGETQKAGGSSSGSLQRATGLALGVARALGITLDLPSSSPSPLPGEGRSEGAQSEGSLLQNNAPLLGRFPTDRSRSTTPSNLFRLQPVSARDLLARSAFELPLTPTGGDGVPAWTLWGRGSAAGFSGQPEDDFKMDGTLYSGYVGVDYRPESTVLLGLAVSHSTGDVSYERTGATKAAVDVELTSMLPYMHWQPRPGLGVWGLAGAGWGKINLKAARDPRMHTTGLTSWLVAVGGRQALTTWQGIDLAAKTDAFLTTVQSKGKTNLPVARGHAQRMRLLMEGRTAVPLSSVSQLSPRMQLGGRYDSGTAEQGLGAELGGGVAYTRTDLGLSVEAQGRYLLVHEDGAFEDWGASVNVRVDPGVAGQGAYLTVAPVWGQTASGVDQLWGNAAGIPQVAGNATAAGWRPHRLAVDVGYGLALADGRGFLTPYGGLALASPGSSRYRLGSRLALSSSLAVSLEGERAEQTGQEPAHGVSVQVGWQW